MKTMNSSGHLFIKHYKISGDSMLAFHLEFLKAFLNSRFLQEYFIYKLTGQVSDSNAVFEKREFSYDKVTNDVVFVSCEKEISCNEKKYYDTRRNIFYDRSLGGNNSNEVIINDRQKKLLSEIKAVFDSNKTDYVIILSPLYDQKQFNSADLTYLKGLFGADRVFDYSGRNRFTDHMRNYYETSHYRPIVAQQILREVYGARNRMRFSEVAPVDSVK